MNVATVNRDLSAQKNLERALRQLAENLERRVEERTFELAEVNKWLVAETVKRAQSDFRFQQLQNEFLHAARITAAGQMAATLATKISQPLTAIVNSVNAAKRLLTNGGPSIYLPRKKPLLKLAEQLYGQAKSSAASANSSARVKRKDE